MLAKLKAESLDLVVGTRHAPGGSSAGLRSGLTSSRATLSNLGKKLSRVVSHAELSDPMSGFFVVDRRFLDEVVRSLSGSGFKILLDLVASARRPLRIAEVPYHFRARLHGDSKLDVLVGLEYLQLLVDKLVGDVIPPRFILFALVGGSGVVLHLLILWLLLGRMPFVTAQTIATLLVMTSNFFLNNALTWRDHRLRGAAMIGGLVKFYLACAVGALVSILIATSMIGRGAPWWVAGLAGIAIASVWNYAVTATTTWRRRRRATRAA